MTADQFWHDDPWLAKAYREAFLLATERRNMELWLQGWYIHKATAVAIYNNLKEKSKKAEKYFEEPIRITPLSEREKEDKTRRERQKIIDFFTAFEKSFNAGEGGLKN